MQRFINATTINQFFGDRNDRTNVGGSKWQALALRAHHLATVLENATHRLHAMYLPVVVLQGAMSSKRAPAFGPTSCEPRRSRRSTPQPLATAAIS